MQLDSIAGIYKTYAQRVLIVPEDSLCNTPWPSMPSSNQKVLSGEFVIFFSLTLFL